MTSARLGWRLASFLADTVCAAPDEHVESHRLFDAYCAWCARRHEVPYLESYFLNEATTLAIAADIPIHQSGSNVSFWNVALKEGALS